MQIVIPCAGKGSRFLDKYDLPKPLIDVNGKAMIERVIENLPKADDYIFIIRKDHNKKYELKKRLEGLVPSCQVVVTDQVTEGAACTVLLAKEEMRGLDDLLIANCDQIIDWRRPGEFTEHIDNNKYKGYSGTILTFDSDHPNNSYCALDEIGLVKYVIEKQVISRVATCGVYYFRAALQFIYAAEQMIRRNIRTNNEFYVAPSYNSLIENGALVSIYNVKGHHPIGTPEELENYLAKTNA